jgi:putative membrane protein insertion efficiency factor
MRQIAIFAIKAYQKAVSPFIPPSCRFYPSCSEYARGAIEKHGLFRGAGLAIMRIVRCHPWNAGGIDPVP